MPAWVHREKLTRNYVADRLSCAYCFSLASLLVLVLAPFFLAYTSHSLWLRENTYREQPDVRFQYKMIMLAEGTKTTNVSTVPMQLFWSTNTSFNNLYHDSVRVPVMRATAEDLNRDARTDLLKVSAEMPLAVGEAIYSVTMLLFFDFRLSDRAKFSMETLGYISEASPLPGSHVSVDADLVLQQSLPLLVKGGFKTPYQKFPLISPSAKSARALLLPGLLQSYRDRNETTNLANKYTVWERQATGIVAENQLARQNFTVSATIRVPPAPVLYVPDWSEVAKVAWIQYLSIFAAIYYLLDILMSFVYTNQILETAVLTTHPAGYAGSKLHKF